MLDNARTVAERGTSPIRFTVSLARRKAVGKKAVELDSARCTKLAGTTIFQSYPKRHKLTKMLTRFHNFSWKPSLIQKQTRRNNRKCTRETNKLGGST
jgi:hypothetical protein